MSVLVIVFVVIVGIMIALAIVNFVQVSRSFSDMSRILDELNREANETFRKLGKEIESVMTSALDRRGRYADEYARWAAKAYSEGLLKIGDLPEELRAVMVRAYENAIRETYLDGWSHEVPPGHGKEQADA